MDKRDETFYIKKIMQLLPEQYELFLELLYSLIRIAVVDEPINCKEIVWLRRMSFILGFNYIDFDKLFRHYFIDETIVDPYQILQVRRNININELHKIYRNLIHTCHPDKLVVYKDIAPEYQAIMQEKFCVLSGAYEQIKRMIGGKHNPR
jgi:preprotein translocase subunit Sec63